MMNLDKKSIKNQLLFRFKSEHRIKYLIFFFFFTFFFIILLAFNIHLFTIPIYENGDAAANSILISLAKKFQLLVGNYSRIGFNHPGPGFLYNQAGFETLLYDISHLVPTPHNAHIIATMFLNSGLLAFVCYSIYDFTKSLSKTIFITSILLVFFGINPFLLFSTWMPHEYFVPFLAFILSATALSSKKAFYLFPLCFTCCLLIHGHVCFIPITIPIFLLSLILCMQKYQFRYSFFIHQNIRTVVASLFTILVFSVPIILNTILDFPGEFGKYLTYGSKSIQSIPDFNEVITFFFHFWSINISSINRFEGIFSFSILLFIFAIIVYKVKTDKITTLLHNFLFIILATSFLFLIYIVKGIDYLNEDNYYTGIFFHSIPLLIIVFSLIGILSIINYNVKFEKIVVSISIFIIIITLLYFNFTNNYLGSSEIHEIITQLKEKPQWKDNIIVFSFEHDTWPKVAGLIIGLEREEKRVYVSDPYWKFMFTKNHVNPTNDAPIWDIYVKG